MRPPPAWARESVPPLVLPEYRRWMAAGGTHAYCRRATSPKFVDLSDSPERGDVPAKVWAFFCHLGHLFFFLCLFDIIYWI